MRRWYLQILLALVVSVVEAVGALLILFLLTNITQPGDRLVVPLAGDLHDRFPGVSESQLFVIIAILIGAFFLMRAALAITQSYLQNKLVYDAGAGLSERLLRLYVRKDFAWHLRRNSAELIRNTNDSVAQIVGNVFIPFVAVASDSLLIVGIAAVLLIKAPLVSLAAIAVLLPLVVCMLRVLQPRYTRIGHIHGETTKQGIQVLQQTFAGIREIKVLAAEDAFTEDFMRSRRQQARALTLRALMLDIPRPVVESSVIILILAFLAWQRSGSANTSSLAILGLFAYAILRVMPAVNRVIANIGVIRFGAAAVDQLGSDLDEISGAPASQTIARAVRQPLRDEIALVGVSVRYPERGIPALNQVTLRIKSGQSVGIVGPTGCGKSTLIDVITGLLHPDEGRVTVDGVDIATCTRAWQACLGLVPQALFLVDDTMRRNVALGVAAADIDDAALEEALRLAQLEDFVAALPEGVDTVVGERGARLSGGQRQRVAIARALYRRPDVLLFDEGTSALDSLTEAELIREIDLLRGERTIVTVAHRLTTVRTCDVIVLMDSGRIVDTGTWRDLVERSASFKRLVAETV